MVTVQLKFNVRASPNVKSVQLLGSWDKYARQIPLSREFSKSHAWTGKFRFQSSMLEFGRRYWYYYILNGYHASHDPAVEYIIEPTTHRKLNILDIPNGDGSSRSRSRSKQTSQQYPQSSSGFSRAPARIRGTSMNEIATGRSLSASRIQHPKPCKPYASCQIREADFMPGTIDDLTERFAGSLPYSPSSPSFSSSSFSLSLAYYSDSLPSFTGSSSSSSNCSFPSSVSSSSDPPTPLSVCRCERYHCGTNTESSEGNCGEMSDNDRDDDYRRDMCGVRCQRMIVRN